MDLPYDLHYHYEQYNKTLFPSPHCQHIRHTHAKQNKPNNNQTNETHKSIQPLQLAPKPYVSLDTHLSCSWLAQRACSSPRYTSCSRSRRDQACIWHNGSHGPRTPGRCGSDCSPSSRHTSGKTTLWGPRGKHIAQPKPLGLCQTRSRRGPAPGHPRIPHDDRQQDCGQCSSGWRCNGGCAGLPWSRREWGWLQWTSTPSCCPPSAHGRRPSYQESALQSTSDSEKKWTAHKKTNEQLVNESSSVCGLCVRLWALLRKYQNIHLTL